MLGISRKKTTGLFEIEHTKMNKGFSILFIILCIVAMIVIYAGRFSLWKRAGLGRIVKGVNDEIDPGFDGSKAVERKEYLIDFKKSKDNVLVFLHIQKTGGTALEKKILKQIVGLKCKCKNNTAKLACKCLRRNGIPWIVMRYAIINKSRGWPCGVHPDITALKHCLPLLFKEQRQYITPKFLYMTQLRDPVERYVSEFRHVQRAKAWEHANLMCNNQQPSSHTFSCFENMTRDNITLERFLSCDKNLANNRQTRMLADLELVGCYNYSSISIVERDRMLLQSAKKNLKAMTYFSLNERPADSQFVIEKTFNLRFKENWFLLDTGYANEYMKTISESDVLKIKQMNHLDVELYKYAEELFEKRLNFLKGLTLDEPLDNQIKKNKKGNKVLMKNWKRESVMGKRPKKKVER